MKSQPDACVTLKLCPTGTSDGCMVKDKWLAIAGTTSKGPEVIVGSPALVAWSV